MDCAQDSDDDKIEIEDGKNAEGTARVESLEIDVPVLVQLLEQDSCDEVTAEDEETDNSEVTIANGIEPALIKDRRLSVTKHNEKNCESANSVQRGD